MDEKQAEIVKNVCTLLTYMAKRLQAFSEVIADTIEKIQLCESTIDILEYMDMVESEYREYIFNPHRLLRLIRYSGELSVIEELEQTQISKVL